MVGLGASISNVLCTVWNDSASSRSAKIFTSPGWQDFFPNSSTNALPSLSVSTSLSRRPPQPIAWPSELTHTTSLLQRSYSCSALMSIGVSTTGNSTWMIVTTLLLVSVSTALEGIAHTPSGVVSGGSTVYVVMYVSNGYSVSSTTTVVSPGLQFVATSATVALPSLSSETSIPSAAEPLSVPFDSNHFTVPPFLRQRL